VRTGVLRAQAEALNEEFFVRMKEKRPWVIAKAAHSLDGRIATVTGESQWISGPEALEEVHRMRSRCDAVMIGVQTALADDPDLRCRLKGYKGKQPLRVVVDSKLRTPVNARMFRSKAPVLVAATRAAAGARRKRLEAAGAEILLCRADQGRVSLKDLLHRLSERNVQRVLMEGGGEILYSGLRARVIDEWKSFVAPVLIGGEKAKGAVSGRGFETLARVPQLRDTKLKRVGKDWLIEGRVQYPG
ncbi:MAG: bifunctional diaminohydroxyphosphoribosylaminopyrimidine deaminase/5-amino-6-(5-phosphoribosylamino)uracil reductase RibD, partial [Candidatus Omnitrophica bacterium]|nr:bifunctional diaminohydroxyphosphoribosylaminopyrimidine deaminase/5-amino-6-(5-phosphoribosylamino)uracil reductase RibD [Candidatus Omnitrophota bacterium]